MISPLRIKLFSLLAASFIGFLPTAHSDTVSTTLTKLADLPNSGSNPSVTSPQDPRGGMLQIGDQLWFTTFAGGENSVGAIVSYDIGGNFFTTRYSFGLPNPNSTGNVRTDGFSPWRTTLVQDPRTGLVYYAAGLGGAAYTSGLGTGSNGGAIGVFNTATVQNQGVNVLWSGGVGTGLPRNLYYTSPILIPKSDGGSSIYINTYAGGASDFGTIQKLTVSAPVYDQSGNMTSPGQVTAVTQVQAFTSSTSTPNTGRQPQENMLLANGKIYITTGSTTSGAAATLQELDPATDTVTVLSTTWNTGSNAGGWNKPVYDPRTNSLYTVTLNQGVLKFNLSTGIQETLFTATGGSVAYGDPVLFGDSLYYMRQSTTVSGVATGGQIWRFDLQLNTSELLYSLANYGGRDSVPSGSLFVGTHNGTQALYFTTNQDTVGENYGALYRLDVVPEPASVGLLLAGVAVWSSRRRRTHSSQAA